MRDRHYEKMSGETGKLSAAVGRAGKNDRTDVMTIQVALNALSSGDEVRVRPLAVDGECGKLTIGAIDRFQLSMGRSPASGTIEPTDEELLAALGLGATQRVGRLGLETPASTGSAPQPAPSNARSSGLRGRLRLPTAPQSSGRLEIGWYHQEVR